MRNPFKPRNDGSAIILAEGTEEKWLACQKQGHVPTTYQYGAHPMRVYQFCPFCHIKNRLDWKDTYARTMNRVWATIPAVITATFAFITIAFIIWAVAHIG